MVALDRYYQRAKNAVHALQALIIFLGAIVTIAMYTKGGKGDGRIHYYFLLCFLSIPVLIYQAAVPIFPRVRRFSHAYAHAALDALWTILWFAAFIGIAVWVHEGSHSAKDWKDGDHECETFNSAWGTVGKCKLGQTSLGMGVVIWLLFVVTTAFSLYGAKYYRTHGSLPVYPTHAAEPLDAEDADNYAFSTNPNDKPMAQEELQEMRPDHQGDEESFPMHTNPQDGPQTHSGRPMSWEPQPLPDQDFVPVDTSYHGSRQPYNPPDSLPPPPPSPLSHRVPSPLSHRIPSPLSNRVPSPRYDTIHSNESHFIGGLQPLPHPPPSPLSGRTPSPGYDSLSVHSNNNSFANDSRFAGPFPPPSLQGGKGAGGAGDPFRDGLQLSHETPGYGGGNGRIDFPEGAYGR